jgi:serine protease inhibitor
MGRPASALAPINRWADSVTRGKIPSILAKPLPDTIAMFLGNAVYFKGKWLEPFEKRATRPHGFTLASGVRVSVAAMEQTSWFAYRREPGYQLVRLPYRGGGAAMYVIISDSGTPPGTLERRFAAQGWPPSLVERDKRDVHLVLPKLHVKLSRDLRPLLDRARRRGRA